ncbi:MAG: ISKra4 family transposase [Ktedonobacteraceae bacterium]
MESAPPAKVGFFPLDEQLGLQPGSLSPRSQEQLVHLAIWMPFRRAVQMVGRLTGVQISEATARRQTYQIGKAVLHGQQTTASRDAAEGREPNQLIVSPDGAMVPLGGGRWGEVKTVVVGKVEAVGSQAEIHSTQLSYFSRMEPAAPFTEHASGELLRRGVDQAKQVCAVMDGAEWIDGFVDYQRQDALRILDFAHAAEYVSDIGQLAQAAGSVLPSDWLPKQLHELKHHGPSAVLREVERLRDQHPELEEVRTKVSYLQKRESRMQYPQYQAAGWPIGSGIVESGNKVVMQARMKGPGMHWEPAHVNPLLALRTSACNDRWDEATASAHTHLFQQRLEQRRTHQIQRYERRLRPLLVRVLLLKSRSTPLALSLVPSPLQSSGSSRPSATHPWRKPLLAKK